MEKVLVVDERPLYGKNLHLICCLVEPGFDSERLRLVDEIEAVNGSRMGRITHGLFSPTRLHFHRRLSQEVSLDIEAGYILALGEDTTADYRDLVVNCEKNLSLHSFGLPPTRKSEYIEVRRLSKEFDTPLKPE